MSAPGTFTVVNDETLCAAVRGTEHVLVYVAPGITAEVVQALEASLASKRSLVVTVIVDLDPEVYRLGYGTEEGLRALQALAQRQHLELRQQPGLRVGLLVTDRQTLVYSPTPLLIEAGSVSEQKPNAVVIARGADATTALTRACGAAGTDDEATPPPQNAEVGRQPATPCEVEQSLASLKEVPAKKFSVARIERVYESKIQFVELELTKYRLSAKQVKIPNDLLIGEDSAFQERLRNNFLLLQGEQTITVNIPELDPVTHQQKLGPDGKPVLQAWTEAKLEAERKALYKLFLINVPRFGQVIMRRNRDRFDQRIAWLQKQIEAFSTAVHEELENKMAEAVKALAKVLLPRITNNIPPRYERGLASAPDAAVLLGLLEHDLTKSFGGSAQVFKPELRCVFKDVTYESIKDPSFRNLLAKVLRDSGGDALAAQLFPEHDAAPEV